MCAHKSSLGQWTCKKKKCSIVMSPLGFQADDIESKIREIIPPGFNRSIDDFVCLLEKDVNFKPFGILLHTYSVHNREAGEDITYQIYKVKKSHKASLTLNDTVFLVP